MKEFLLWFFSVTFGYDQDHVTLENGDIDFICPNVNDACIKCKPYAPRRTKTSDDINIGTVWHKKSAFTEAIPMENSERANKLFDTLLGIWQKVRGAYTTRKEFNRFLVQCVWDLTTPPDEKVSDVPSDIPSDIPETDLSSPDGVNASLRGTYNFTEVFKLFVEAIGTDENKATLRNLGMPHTIFP
jgi:hypothetical protein